jgi:UDP-N-acetylglucosamine 2-epimerase
MIGLKCDKFFVWGKSDFEYFSKQNNIDAKKLIISGSPRLDRLFQIPEKNFNFKINTVLLTLSPISERSGLGDVNLMIKYNNFLNEILLILKKLKIENIIVKLHPGENPHNLILLKFLKKYSNVVIYQTNNPEKLLISSDLMINISPELYDSSTIMLEQLILQKPVIQIAFNNKIENKESSTSPIIQINNTNDFEKIIQKIMTEKSYLKELKDLIPKKLENYLSFHGESNKKIFQLIK